MRVCVSVSAYVFMCMCVCMDLPACAHEWMCCQGKDWKT